MNCMLTYSAKDTLKSFGMTAYEFYNKLTIGTPCCGLYNSNDLDNLANKLNCGSVECHKCPISIDRTDKEIKDWLINSNDYNVSLTTSNETTLNNRLDTIESKLDKLIELFTISQEI